MTVTGVAHSRAGWTPRPRHDGWTAQKRRVFLSVLAAAGCVTDACRHVGISTTSAYRHRRLNAAFDRDWDKALAQAKPAVEREALRRAVEGWDEVIRDGDGEVVSTRRRYSDALLGQLLRIQERREMREMAAIDRSELEPGAMSGGAGAGGPVSDDKVMVTLKGHLEGLAKRMTIEEDAALIGGDAELAERLDRERPGWRARAQVRQATGTGPPAAGGLPGLPGGPPI